MTELTPSSDIPLPYNPNAFPRREFSFLTASVTIGIKTYSPFNCFLNLINTVKLLF
jgi:hypothetical protein